MLLVVFFLEDEALLKDTLIQVDFIFEDVNGVRSGLNDVSYLADDGIAGIVYLADRLAKPVLI